MTKEQITFQKTRIENAKRWAAYWEAQQQSPDGIEAWRAKSFREDAEKMEAEIKEAGH